MVIEGLFQLNSDPEGAKMHNPLALDVQTQHALNVLGAELVVASGFENEQADLEFEIDEFAGEEA